MSSSFAPPLIGLVTAALLVGLIAVFHAARRRLTEFRLRRKERVAWKSKSRMTRGERTLQPNAPRAPSSSLAEQQATRVGAEPQLDRLRLDGGTAVPIGEAQRQAQELLDEAALEAKRIVVTTGREHLARHASEQEQAALERKRLRLDSLATIQEAEHKAEELLLGAEQQCASLVREAEAEAKRRAAEISADARRRADEGLEEAEREAEATVVNTAQERALLLTQLERERSLLEIERTKLAEPTPVEAAAQPAEGLLVAAERGREVLRESEAEADRKASEITEGARRQAQELLQEAELEGARIIDAAGHERARREKELAQELSALEETRAVLGSLAAIEEAARIAEEQLAAAEQQREELRSASEADAERLIGDARRQAQELLEEAKLEAERIVDAAGRERAQRENELAQQRSVFEERRARLSAFLTDVLEEVESAPAASEGAANGRDLDESLSATAPASADH